MSYLSFENNTIEASGNLILKPTNGSIDCSEATISNVTIAGRMIVTSNDDISFNNSNLVDVSSIHVHNDVSCSYLLVDTIGFENHNIIFNGSNLRDVSSIQVNRIDATDIYVDGSLTVINTIDLDISDNIIGLNKGHVAGNKTSGMLINYGDASNIFFGYHNEENAFVIVDTSFNHDDVSRNIVLDKYVDLKVGNTTIYNDSSDAILEVKVDDNFDCSLNAEIRVFGGGQGESKIIWGAKTTSTDQYGGCIYYDASTKKTEFQRITTNSTTLIYDTVFEYNDTSSNVTFMGEIHNNALIRGGILKAFFNNGNNITTGLSRGTSYIDFNKYYKDSDNVVYQAQTQIGYLEPDNNVLYMNNSKGMIQIKRFVTSTITPVFEIGNNDGISDDINNYKHYSNVTIEAPLFNGDVSGNATSATNILLTNDTSSENEHNIVFTSTSTSTNDIGSLKIANSKLKYDPSLNILTSGSFNATSDYRTKTNIEELDENITVSNLRPLVYLKNGKKEIGLIAHELQEVYPFMVCGEKDGKEMQSVNYDGLIGVLINDVKRLTNENKILKLNNDTLYSRLDNLEEKFNKKFE